MLIPHSLFIPPNSRWETPIGPHTRTHAHLCTSQWGKPRACSTGQRNTKQKVAKQFRIFYIPVYFVAIWRLLHNVSAWVAASLSISGKHKQTLFDAIRICPIFHISLLPPVFQSVAVADTQMCVLVFEACLHTMLPRVTALSFTAMTLMRVSPGQLIRTKQCICVSFSV